MMPPLKIYYTGNIEELPKHLEDMGKMYKNDMNIPPHSLTVVLKGDKVSLLHSLEKKGRSEGYHVVTIEGDLYMGEDFEDTDPFRLDNRLGWQWPFNSDGNTRTLIFYIGTERMAA